MRPLSRLLSVFLALILMGLSVMAASADAPTDATGDNDTNKGGDYVTMTVELVSDEDPAYVNDELEFLVTIYRLDGAHDITGGNLTGPAMAVDAMSDDSAIDTLNDQNSYRDVKVKYTVATADLGSASKRTATLTWKFDFTGHTAGADANTDDHTDQSVTATVKINVAKRPAAEGGASEVLIDFPDVAAPAIEKGEEIEFTLMVTTGVYGYAGKSFTIKRQYYDADGDKDGGLLPVAGMTIPALGDTAESAEIPTSPEAYKLSQRDIDVLDEGGKIEFSYEIVINEADLVKAGSTDRIDFNNDGNIGLTDADDADSGVAVDGDVTSIAAHDKVETVKGTLLELPAVAAEVEAEPTPEPYIGMNDAAKVMQGDGNIIHITFADGSETSVGVGALTAMGDIDPHPNGYVRDSDLGQTYAVVQRTDGMVVRKWISSDSPLVSQIDWAAVNTSYTFSAEAVNAIPLDGMHPSNNQLVKVGMHIYVNLAGDWWHIPDIPTFEARGYYWCDVTSADERFETYVMNASMLPSVGGSPTPGYPSCR